MSTFILPVKGQGTQKDCYRMYKICKYRVEQKQNKDQHKVKKRVDVSEQALCNLTAWSVEVLL